MSQYRIVAEPDGAINAKKESVTYRVEGAEGQHIRWRTRNGSRARVLYYLSEKGHKGPEGPKHWTTKWRYPGKHEVVVEIMTKEGTLGFGDEWEPIATHTQQVKADLSWVDAYKIIAVPPLRSITPETELKFHIERSLNDPAFPVAEDLKVRWYRLNYADDTEKEMRAQLLHGGYCYTPITFKGNNPGHHRVLAEIKYKNQRRAVIEFPQEVVSLDQVLEGGPIRPLSKEDLQDPEVILRTSKNELQVLGILEQKQSQMPANKKEEYEQYKEQRKTFITKLEERLKSTQGKRRFPVKAQYYQSTTTQWSTLRVFVSPMNETGTKWSLVDWTQPDNQNGTSESIGEGRTPHEALINAFKAWDQDNRYPEGVIHFEFDHPSNNIRLKSRFKTDGESDGDTIANVLGWIGLGAAVVAGVVTLVAPVPGSRVASAAIWSSIFTSSAASAIKMGQRFDEGFSNSKDDGIDALTIIGNVFTAGTAGRALTWARGANVAIQQKNGLIRYALIGEISTEASQGVLIGLDYYDAFIEIGENPNLTPKERLTRLMKKSTELATDTLLTTFNFKASKADLKTLNTRNQYFDVGNSPQKKLDALKQPETALDLTKPKVMEGHSSTGKHSATVSTSHSVVMKGGGGSGSGGSGGKGGGGSGKGGNPPTPPGNPHPGLHNRNWDDVNVKDESFSPVRNVDMDNLSEVDAKAYDVLKDQGKNDKDIEQLLNSGNGFHTKELNSGDVLYGFDSKSNPYGTKNKKSMYWLDEEGYQVIKKDYYKDGVWNKEGVKNHLALPCYNRADVIDKATVTQSHTVIESTVGKATEQIGYTNNDYTTGLLGKIMPGGGTQITPDSKSISTVLRLKGAP